MKLDSCKRQPAVDLPPEMTHIQTPARLEVWKQLLANHPDQKFAGFILEGLSAGFRVGFQHGSSLLRQASRNMRITEPQVVSDYIRDELQAGRLVELTETEAEAWGVHCSPIGIIPKKNKPGKWRLIVDLSAPEEASVNDGIEKETCSLSYISVDTVADRVLNLGQGALLAKMDVKQAYRMVPVHPQDRPLLGMRWAGKVFVDKTLPFGLRSAPLIFSALADALAWSMRQKGVTFAEHYIDDFVTVGRQETHECQKNMEAMLKLCEATGTPIDPGKTEGPCTTITFLGIEIDSVSMQLRLPADKLARLEEMLEAWHSKKCCKKRELLSLIGVLAHACKVVRAGRSFMRRLIELGKTAKELHYFIRLNNEARSDIQWWRLFAKRWNGVSMMFNAGRDSCSITVTSDASGGWGCGAFSGSDWFQMKWPEACQDLHITIKELIPIVWAAAVWGHMWQGKGVMSYCDNAAVVAIVNKGDSREAEAMHLLRCLAFLKAKFQFALYCNHIQGARNELADALSRDRVQLFLSHCPQASHTPTPIPAELLDLTVVSKPDWTSSHWTSLWTTTFGQD